MGTCVCCGAETRNGFKICPTCDSVARSNPCGPCKAEHGPQPGCQDTCDKHAKWLTCYRAIKKLGSDRRKQRYHKLY